MSTPARSIPWVRWVIVFLVLAVLGVIGKYLLTQKGIRSRLEAALARQNRDHPRWRLADIQADREKVPDPENAALVVLSIKRLVGAASTVDLDLALHDRPANVGVPAWRMNKVRAGLVPLAPAVAAARKLERLLKGCFPINYPPNFISSPLDGIQDVRTATHLLQLDTAVRVEKKDLAGAMSNCIATLNGARAIGDEPMAIPQLVRTAGVSIACNMLEWVMGHGEPPSELLAEAQAILEKESGFPGFEVTVHGELALINQLLEALEDGTVTLEDIGGEELRKRWLGVFEIDVVREGHAEVLEFYRRPLDVVRLPVHERAAPLEAALRDFDDKRPMNRVAAIFATALGKFENADRRRLMWVRSTVAGLAAERYRRANGKWPASVEDLRGLAAADALIDPGDGKPLRIKKEADGILIYSVGMDGADNGGVIDRQDPTRTGIDVGFRLWDPTERGKPAPPEEPPSPDDIPPP